MADSSPSDLPSDEHAKLDPETFAANISSSPKRDDLCKLFDLL